MDWLLVASMLSIIIFVDNLPHSPCDLHVFYDQSVE